MDDRPTWSEVVSGPAKPSRNRVFVSDDRCTLVDLWPDGTVTVATRNHPSEIWSPPTYMKEEK